MKTPTNNTFFSEWSIRTLTRHTSIVMYFYARNINEHEQNILLEMCIDACVHFRTRRGGHGIKIYTNLFESCGANCFRNFLFYDPIRK